MASSNWLTNLAIAITFGAGIFFPVLVVFDSVPVAIAGGVIASILFFLFLRVQGNKAHKKEGTQVKANMNLYMRRFAITMTGYIVFLFGSIYLLERVESQVLSVIIAMLPMIPVFYGMWAYMQWVRNLDEFQQRIQFEAIAFSLGMTGMVTFTIGFLENAGIPQPGLIWIFPMIIMFWQIGLFIATRRYE